MRASVNYIPPASRMNTLQWWRHITTTWIHVINCANIAQMKRDTVPARSFRAHDRCTLIFVLQASDLRCIHLLLYSPYNLSEMRTETAKENAWIIGKFLKQREWADVGVDIKGSLWEKGISRRRNEKVEIGKTCARDRRGRTSLYPKNIVSWGVAPCSQ
jgi:hypothetical protein